MGKQSSPAKKQQRASDPYSSFDQLDGQHPWMEDMPEGHIAYPVRKLKQGEVALL